jgi:hypothetical protein
VHLTGGILRHFRAFSRPEQNPALGVLSTPAHPQVTQTVSQLLISDVIVQREFQMKIIERIQKYSTGKNVIILFSITMVVYLTILLYSIPKVVSSAPEIKLFDVSPSGYTTEYAISLLNAIGQEGRELYLSLQLPLDFIYPGLFIISYSLLFAWLLKKNYSLESKVYYAIYIPIFAGLFDYTENVLIIMMLKTYPNLNSNLVTVASFATITKSILSSIFFTLLIAGIIQVVWKSLFKKQGVQS